MASPSQEFLIVSRRNQPTELHLSDGTVAFLEPRGTLAIAASVRSSPQLLALERQHAVTVRPAVARGQPEDLAEEADASDESRTSTRSERTRTK